MDRVDTSHLQTAAPSKSNVPKTRVSISARLYRSNRRRAADSYNCFTGDECARIQITVPTAETHQNVLAVVVEMGLESSVPRQTSCR